MSLLERRASQVLEAARKGHDPSPADAARVRAALRARAALEPGSFAEAPVPAAAAGLGPLQRLLGALLIGGAAGFAAGFQVAHSLSPQPEPPPLPAPHAPREPSLALESAPLAPSEPELAMPDTREASNERATPASGEASSARAQRGPARTPITPARPTERAGPSSLALELDGLRRAQELLHRGQPAWALARLDELDRVAPGGALLEERAATRASAQCLQQPGARAPLDDFARRYPGSAHLDQVRSSCAPRPATAPSPDGTRRAETPRAAAANQQTENPGSRHE